MGSNEHFSGGISWRVGYRGQDLDPGQRRPLRGKENFLRPAAACFLLPGTQTEVVNMTVTRYIEDQEDSMEDDSAAMLDEADGDHSGLIEDTDGINDDPSA